MALELGKTIGALFESVDTDPAVSLAPIVQAMSGSYGVLFRKNRAGIPEAACHGIDARYGDRLKEASRLKLVPAWLDEIEAGGVVDRAAYGNDRQFGRTAFCHHVVRPEGDFHCMIATAFASGQDRFHLVVGRPRTHSAFDGDSRRLLRWMLPHVAEILRLRADLAATRFDLVQAERALDGVDQPVLVVACDATVLSANRAARRLTRSRNPLWLDGRQRLTATSAAATATLRDAVRCVEIGGEVRTLSVPRADEGAPLLLTLSRLPHADVEPPHRGRVMIVAEACETGDDERRLAGTARSFGLTRRECDIVAALARGATLKVAACELGMSYNTARGHMRQIFGKTAVHRQGDLMRLVATGVRPGRGRRG